MSHSGDDDWDDETEAIGRGDTCVHGVGFDVECDRCEPEDEDDDDLDLIADGVCEHGLPMLDFCEECGA